MRNRVFFPQTALDQWLVDMKIDMKGTDLTVLSDGSTYRLAEAVRVLREVTGAEDPHELVGLVKSRAYLEELGAEILESSMVLGDNAYDVAPGWLGAPLGTGSEGLSTEERLARHLSAAV